MFDALRQSGFDIAFEGHAEAILASDFPEAVGDLEAALEPLRLPVDELIAGGGGEAPITQRLRRALTALGWNKTTFTVVKTVNGQALQSQSHIVDHVRRFDVRGAERSIALEIEWNNKDPFFDRDLDNFKRLHGDGAISLGIVITRGADLHAAMSAVVEQRLVERGVADFEGLAYWRYNPTVRQRRDIGRRAAHEPFAQAFAKLFVADKFGEATTHWSKLADRLARGVGNPCPLLLLGLPAAIVTFG